MDRRRFVQSAAVAATAGTIALPSWFSQAVAAEPAPNDASLAMPGPYPGRVIEVAYPGKVAKRDFKRESVDRMLARGMTELTGADDGVSAWKSLFTRGDVVGVKVNPVGRPLAISNHVTVHAIVDALKSAGVRAKDIIMFTRYESEATPAGYPDHVPDGVRYETSTQEYDPSQLDIKGYDPEVFCTMDFIEPSQHDPNDDRARRSHLCEIVSKKINKMVTIPVLKDHGSGGITGALKNMSHGFVNNVARSHSGHAGNTCNVFIPAVCAMRQIREKATLHIMDGLVGVYQGGPFGPTKNYKFTWPYGALFFGTDPVAMDRIEWQIIDAKRAEMNLPPVAGSGKTAQDPLGTEGFDVRQPQHVNIAAGLGLGVADPEKIEHRKVKLT
jgi:hypothetical protein